MVNIGSVVWCFFYQTSGRVLYLQLTDGVSFFFGFVYFFISVGWFFAVDKIAVGALLFLL